MNAKGNTGIGKRKRWDNYFCKRPGGQGPGKESGRADLSTRNGLQIQRTKRVGACEKNSRKALLGPLEKIRAENETRNPKKEEDLQS